MTTILVVDDERAICDVLAIPLRMAGFRVFVAYNGAEALRLAAVEQIDLALLDRDLPDMEGMEICHQLRVQRPLLPIIFVTGKTTALEKINGLESGADDYISKPFEPLEVVARVRALWRRTSVSRVSGQQYGPFQFDWLTHEVRKDGVIVHLPLKEYDLVKVLVERREQALTRDELLNAVWGSDFFGDPKTVDVHMYRVREKLEAAPARPKFFVTVRGVGYKFTTQNS